MRRTATMLVVAAVGLVFGVWVIGAWAPPAVMKAVDSVVFAVLPWLAVATMVWAARSAHGRLRAAWLCMTVGLISWAGEATATAYYVVVQHAGMLPPGQKWPFLVFPIGVAAGLLLLPIGMTKQFFGRFVLDSVIVSGSFFLVLWLVVTDEFYRTSAQADMLVLVLAYSTSELAVLTIALLVTIRSPRELRLTVGLLTAGLFCLVVSDGVYGYVSVEGGYAYGSVLDIGWAAGMLLITVAPLTAREPKTDARSTESASSWPSVWLPYVAGVFVVLAAATAPLSDLITRPVMVIAAVLGVAVFVRQLLVVRDNQRLLARVADQALRDPLTGVGNYALFNKRVSDAMQRRERDGVPVAVVVLDLDDFKLINDNHGHPAGDELLRLVAGRICEVVRPGDTVARLGGDEFGIVMTGEVDDAQRVTGRVVDVFAAPFVVDGHELSVRLSAGLAVADANGSVVSIEELLKRADTAMYSGKWAGFGGLHTYSPEMLLARADREISRTAGALTRGRSAAMAMMNALRGAVERAELTLVYQPQFDLRTGVLVGFEALLRWPHPDKGVLMPDDFLPLIRQHGLMRAVTDLVFQKAFDDAARWKSAGIDVRLAVNLFAPSLADPGMPERLATALTVRGLPTSMVTVEITEHLIMGDLHRTRRVLQQLRERNVRVAIDDFGTGYSTLSYLRELPSDEVKLDREFIAPVLTDPRAATVVCAVVGLAHALGVTTVAEGVENAETAVWLRDHGCDVAQGFYYGRPLEFTALLERFAPARPATPATAPASAKSS